jgi:hypothetical protein
MCRVEDTGFPRLSVLLSVTAAGFSPFGLPSFRRHEASKRQHPSTAAMQIETLAAQDARNTPAQDIRAPAIARPPVRVPAFVRGAGLFLRPALNGAPNLRSET